MIWYDKFILAGLALWIGGGLSILVGFYGLQKNRPKFMTVRPIDLPMTQNNSLPDELRNLRGAPMPLDMK